MKLGMTFSLRVTNRTVAVVATTAILTSASTAFGQGIPGAVATPDAAPEAPAAAPAASDTPAAALSPAAVAEAQAKWQNLCSTCHGPQGKGDGPAGMALQPRPRDLSSAAWQSSVTDEHIEKVILNGGQSVNLSVLMPANPDLTGKPEVLKALRAHVRGLAGK